MGYKLLGMVVWNGVKWIARRKVGGGSTPKRAKYAAGAAVVIAAFAFVLTRREGEEE